MEQQIEEMAKIMCKPTANKGNCERCGFHKQCSNFDDATALYNANFRKQSEGEWKKVSEKYPRYVCTACNHLYNNKEYKYCPNCGAKMKGARDEKRS